MILVGLIGWPVGHSRSPLMHNAAFRAAGLDGYYALLPVPPQRVGEAVLGLRALGFRGANVTVPHKQAVIPYLDSLTAEARAIGAVNTMVVDEQGTLWGTNTDAPGFMRDLETKGLSFRPLRERGALILGAGGSARAVAYALAMRQVPIHILARRVEQAQTLVASLAPHIPQPGLLQPHPWDELPRWGPRVQLIVHCTPVGMHPHEEASPWPQDLPILPHQWVYDLIYNPPRTRLMVQAQESGARAWNGLGMLVYQGALAWEQWTGQPAPVEAMWAALNPPNDSPESPQG